jgi:MipA family protein
MNDQISSRTPTVAIGASLAAAIGLCGAAAHAQDGGWDVSVGPAVVLAPEYPGAEDSEASPIPAVDIAYGSHLFLNWRRGIGAYFVNNPRWQLGASLYQRGDRDHRDSPRLAGLEDIDDSAVAQLLFTRSFGPLLVSTTVAQAISENTGLTVEATAEWRFHLSAATFATLGARGVFGDGKYMQTWFGVTPEQARASGLAEHSIGSGLRTGGAFASVSHELSPQWRIAAFAAYDVLVGDPADSPIVEREAMPTLGLGAFYRFAR